MKDKTNASNGGLEYIGGFIFVATIMRSIHLLKSGISIMSIARTTRFSALLFLLFLITLQTYSQNSAEVLQALKKLNNVGSVLYVAAHPDDENTRLLAYLANERRLRAGYISLTRGDGGQNLIGKEQGESLGLIRTQELLAARRTDGAEQFFTRANDFGYSKNPEETFAIWNKDSVLADLVWVIRRFKPDVIITRFPTTGEGGHGHHTASAMLALEAFTAAADPTKFPSQLKHTTIWQARRIFWNTFNFGSTNTTSPDQLKIDVGQYNPLIGKSYGEIAADSRSMHKSQGFGSAAQRGENIEFFKLLMGDSVRNDLFEGIEQSWKRISGSSALQPLINNCIEKFDPEHPESVVPLLVIVHKQMQLLQSSNKMEQYWKEQKLKETEALLLMCSGLWMEASVSDYSAVPGQEMNITAQIIHRNKGGAFLNSISFLQQTDTTTALLLDPNELYSFRHKEKLPADTHFSNPYWLNEKHSSGLYNVQDRLLIGTPENQSPVFVVFDLNISGLNLKIRREIIHKYVDPVQGEVYRPLEILPPATLNIQDKVFVFENAGTKNIQITVKANADNIAGTLTLEATDGWGIAIKNPEFILAKKGSEAIITATILPNKETINGKLTASIKIKDSGYTKSIRRIEYDHIPYQFILSDAEADLINVELKKSGLNVGYIPGAGDDVAACLKQIGYKVTELTDEKLTNENLNQYNAIVTGIRAYNTNDRLQVHYNKLMEYVNNGGNLIVQYNTNSRVGPVKSNIGPYPFTISRDRVTNENSTVTFINEKHPILNYPNVITQKDFDGWIQERGIYFATEVDPHYENILRMSDPGEKENDNGLIVTHYGKGNFVYTGLVFFRELPAGVPGAYRLFVNLLSLPKNE